MPTGQHTIIPLKEQRLKLAHRGKDGLEEIVCLLCVDDFREGNRHG